MRGIPARALVVDITRLGEKAKREGSTSSQRWGDR